MRNMWFQRVNLFKKRLHSEGLFLSMQYYYQRICRFLYGVIVFGRTDINIFPDARLVGVDCIHIGKEFIAGRGLWMEVVKDYLPANQHFQSTLIIGNRVSVGEYVHIGCNHRVIIGNDVLMGSKIYITDHNHGIYHGDNHDSPAIPPNDRRLTEGECVNIGDRCWIGEFVTILPGVTIGAGCIIGSHSTVTHDIPANSIAVGSPARVVKQWKENAWLKTNYFKDDVTR